MRTSLIISFSMHFAVVAAAFIVLPEAEKFEVKKTESIPVEVLTVAEFTKLTAKTNDKKAEKKPKPIPKLKPVVKKVQPKLPPEKKLAKVVPPKPPEPKVETPPPPKLKKVEKKPEPEKKKVETKRPPKSVPVPRVRPKFAEIKPKKKSTFDTKIAALLNKLPEDTAAAETSVKKKPDTKKTKSRFNGQDATISASERDLLRRRIGNCWSTPVGVKDAEKLIVKIKFFLKRDGTLSRPPVVLNSTSDIAADSALRAIRRCGPYDMLSPKKYSAWREIVINFDPSEMFGG